MEVFLAEFDRVRMQKNVSTFKVEKLVTLRVTKVQRKLNLHTFTFDHHVQGDPKSSTPYLAETMLHEN